MKRGEILGVVGGSGGGKSVLLRTIIGLIPKRAGTIELFGLDTDTLEGEALRAVQRRWGVMFQQGALFSSLTVRQNLQFQMREALHLSDRLKEEMAIARLEMVGLKASDGDKMPSELSGGMTKRVALARALALDPEFVLLDEPTSGLDPIAAGDFDELDQDVAVDARPDRFPGHARSGEPLRGMRPGGGAGRGQGGGAGRDRGSPRQSASLGTGIFPGQARQDACDRRIPAAAVEPPRRNEKDQAGLG